MKNLLTPNDLALRWEVPIGTVYSMVHRGLIPNIVRISPRRWRIRLEDLEQWEEEQTDRTVR